MEVARGSDQQPSSSAAMEETAKSIQEPGDAPKELSMDKVTCSSGATAKQELEVKANHDHSKRSGEEASVSAPMAYQVGMAPFGAPGNLDPFAMMMQMQQMQMMQMQNTMQRSMEAIQSSVQVSLCKMSAQIESLGEKTSEISQELAEVKANRTKMVLQTEGEPKQVAAQKQISVCLLHVLCTCIEHFLLIYQVDLLFSQEPIKHLIQTSSTIHPDPVLMQAGHVLREGPQAHHIPMPTQRQGNDRH